MQVDNAAQAHFFVVDLREEVCDIAQDNCVTMIRVVEAWSIDEKDSSTGLVLEAVYRDVFGACRLSAACNNHRDQNIQDANVCPTAAMASSAKHEMKLLLPDPVIPITAIRISDSLNTPTSQSGFHLVEWQGILHNVSR